MKTAAEIDPALAAVFASPTPVYIPNTSFYMSNDTESQFALAITGGYRGRFAWPPVAGGGTAGAIRRWRACTSARTITISTGSTTNTSSPSARLDTNAQGLLVVNPA